MKVTFEIVCDTTTRNALGTPEKVWVLRWDNRDYREITAMGRRFETALTELLRLAASEIERDFPER